MTTKPDTLDLSAAQERALAALLRGTTVTVAADEAGVTRQTVSGWRNGDPDFIAAYNRGRLELWEAEQARLSAIRTKALDVVDAALDGEDATSLALDVLKLLARLSVEPRGSTLPERVASDLALESMLGAL